ncbi:MAG: tetratricopeptide repeat protein [Pseudomonadota bacterium]
MAPRKKKRARHSSKELLRQESCPQGLASRGQESPEPPGTEADAPATVYPRWLAAILGALVACVTLAAFSNATSQSFVHDDKFYVPRDLSIDAGTIVKLFSEDVGAAAGAPSGIYRPLHILSLGLESRIHDGSPSSFHKTTVALHVLATLLLYGFLLSLGSSALAAGRATPLIAAAAALVFGVHPVHTEAVDSIFNRSEIVVTIAAIGACWVARRYATSRPWMAWPLIAAIYLVALLFRESAVTLPILAALFVAILGRRSSLVRLPVVVLVVPLVAYLFLRHAAISGTPPASVAAAAATATDTLSPGERVASVFDLIREGLRMLVWPHPLRAAYDELPAGGYVLSFVVTAALLAAAWLSRRLAPLVSAAVLFFSIALLPSSRLFSDPANSVAIAERYVYLPSVALALFLAFLIATIVRRLGALPAALFAALLCVVLVPQTRARNLDWRSDVALWEAEARSFPESGDAQRLLSGAYLDTGRVDDVVTLCDRHLAAHPRLAKLHTHCAIAYDRTGQVSQAEQSYRRAVELGLGAVAHANLARLLARIGRAQEAETEYQRAVDTEPDPARQHYRRGQMLLRFHPERQADARAELEAALRLQPRFAPAKEALRALR